MKRILMDNMSYAKWQICMRTIGSIGNRITRRRLTLLSNMIPISFLLKLSLNGTTKHSLLLNIERNAIQIRIENQVSPIHPSQLRFGMRLHVANDLVKRILRMGEFA